MCIYGPGLRPGAGRDPHAFPQGRGTMTMTGGWGLQACTIYIYTCILIYLSIYLSLSISIYLYLSLSISIYLYLSLSISIYLYLSLSISIYLSLSIYLSIHVCTHVCTCIHIPKKHGSIQAWHFEVTDQNSAAVTWSTLSPASKPSARWAWAEGVKENVL